MSSRCLEPSLQSPDLRTSRTTQLPKDSNESPYALQLASCLGDSLGCELNVRSPCYLRPHALKNGQKMKCPSGKRDFAAERVDRMNERVRDLRRLLEADSRNLSSRIARKNPMFDNPANDKSPLHMNYLSTSDNYSRLDITLSYESSSDTFSSPKSTDFAPRDDNPAGCGVESQATNLRGVGQWTDELQRNSQGLWQNSPTSVDTSEDSGLDLMGVHALAATKPFEQYFRTRKNEEGALNYQNYTSLP